MVEIISEEAVWQYGLWSFQAGGTKLERFLRKNQHTQRKILNSEFWINPKLKIQYFFLCMVILRQKSF